MSNKEWKLHQTEREVLVEPIDKSEEKFVDSKSPEFNVSDSGQESLSDQDDFQLQNLNRTPKLNIKNSNLLSNVLLLQTFHPINFTEILERDNTSLKIFQYNKSVNPKTSRITSNPDHSEDMMAQRVIEVENILTKNKNQVLKPNFHSECTQKASPFNK